MFIVSLCIDDLDSQDTALLVLIILCKCQEPIAFVGNVFPTSNWVKIKEKRPMRNSLSQ